MAVETRESILSILQKNQQQIRALGVRRHGLFGSFARGEQDKDSDVDVLVDFVPGGKGFDNFIRLVFLLLVSVF